MAILNNSRLTDSEVCTGSECNECDSTCTAHYLHFRAGLLKLVHLQNPFLDLKISQNPTLS
jgi:hypothetical protein